MKGNLDLIIERFPNLQFEEGTRLPTIYVEAEQLEEVARFLKETPELTFDYLNCLSAVDYMTDFEVVYHFFSYVHQHTLVLKVKLDREKPKIPSLTFLWKTADWQEREAYDLFGIIFIGHPKLRRILLTEDFEGFPMRKEFKTQGHQV